MQHYSDNELMQLPKRELVYLYRQLDDMLRSQLEHTTLMRQCMASLLKARMQTILNETDSLPSETREAYQTFLAG